MFKSCLYRHRNIYGAAIHSLIDDKFQTLIETDSKLGLAFPIVQEYRAKELPIAPNMALYYLWACGRNIRNVIERMELDCKIINYNAPAWRYGEKIYPCVVRQINQRMFGRRK